MQEVRLREWMNGAGSGLHGVVAGSWRVNVLRARTSSLFKMTIRCTVHRGLYHSVAQPSATMKLL